MSAWAGAGWVLLVLLVICCIIGAVEYLEEEHRILSRLLHALMCAAPGAVGVGLVVWGLNIEGIIGGAMLLLGGFWAIMGLICTVYALFQSTESIKLDENSGGQD